MTAPDGEGGTLAHAADALGFELRPIQERAVRSLLDGADTLVVMPTGAGKSAIYQAAGMLRPGSTIVVSPLLALQADQVASIPAELGGAAALNSLLSSRQRAELLRRATCGELEFIFVSPELLADERVIAALASTAPSLLVVDEAHCISMWGHAFRPDYLALTAVLEALGRPPVLALTASAAPPVRTEIVERLAMRRPAAFVTGFERTNLHLAVRHVPDRGEAETAALAMAGEAAGRGVIYVARRADAERLAARLDAAGAPTEPYHAGLPGARRDAVLERFRDDPTLNVVATNAFGLGIDVPDVRYVLHVEAPDSLDAYYQEVGRAGRDGEPAMAICWSVTARASRRLQGSGSIDHELAAAVFGQVRDGANSVAALQEANDVGRRRLATVVAELEAIGALRRRGRRLVAVGDALDVDAVRSRSESRRSLATGRARMLERYLDGDGCRWHRLCAYFGEQTALRCGHCDCCDEGAGSAGASVAPSAEDRDLPVGQAVIHEQFGLGVIVDRDGASVTVLFDDAGYRVLDSTLASGGLLRPAGRD